MKHKWLEEIGITSYPDNNFGGYRGIKDIIRGIRIKFQKHKTGVDSRDCWNLDATFYMWLYEHLKQFLADADIVDLEYYKFTYKKKEYTQLGLINLLCNKLEQMIKWDEFKGIDDSSKDYKLVENEDGTKKLEVLKTEEEKAKDKAIYLANKKKYYKLKTDIFKLWKMLIDYIWW